MNMEQKTMQHSHKSFISHAETTSSERTLFDTVGDELKRARLAQKYDIKTVADRLKIKDCYIEALEKNDYKQFPAVAYGIGFLRTYARFLGLDADSLAERFKSETTHLVASTAQVPMPNRQNVLPSKKTLAVCLVLLAGLCGVWYGTGQKRNQSIELLPTEPIMTVAPVVIEPIITAPVESDALLSQETEPIANELNAIVPLESVAPNETASDLTVSPEKQAEAPQETGTTLVSGKKYGSPEKAALVFVATDRVWMEVKKENKVVFEHILSKGDGYFVPADETGLRMRTGNARGLDVYVNGVPKGKLSPTETVKKNILLDLNQFESR